MEAGTKTMETVQESVRYGLRLHRVVGADRAALLAQLSTMANTKDPSKFPGPNPCSLERADFTKLTQQCYFVCEKTDGVRFLLVCCEHSGRKVCAIVDRTLTVYLLPLQAMPTAMFEGSVVDCELAYNKALNQPQLLAFDAYVVSGVPIFRLPFSHRVQALQRAMRVYRASVGDPVSLTMKRFLPTFMFNSYAELAESAAASYDVDGLILTPETSEVTFGRWPDLLKLKTKHTVDFYVGADGVDLCVFTKQGHVAVERSRGVLQPGSVAECLRAADGLWDVVCVRTDKTTANDKLTYEKTMLNMQENITMNELAAVFLAKQQALTCS